MMKIFLAAIAIAPASCWLTRDNVGGRIPPITCGGGIFNDAMKATILGENPDVPVGVISRFPMVNPTEKILSDFHVYCALVLMFILFAQFIGPKGSDPDEQKAKFHVVFGRIYSWAIAPHYALIGLALNFYAVFKVKMEDWLLAPAITDWRIQLAYIYPFGVNVLVTTVIGFYLNRYKFMSGSVWCMILKALSLLSVVFWFTIGVYVSGSQILGGLGGFGLPPEKTVPGAGVNGYDNQLWFRVLNVLVFGAGTFQAGIDFINYKILVIVEKTGNKELSWKNQHKWSMLVYAYQSGFIFGFFVAMYPYCLVFPSLPAWTCLELFAAVPVALMFIWPVMVHCVWLYTFVKSVLGMKLLGAPPMSVAEFSKHDHKWDQAWAAKPAKEMF